MDITTVLTRAVAQVEKEDELKALLRQKGRRGKPLRVKLGFDPSRPDLTLGHGVVLRKLRQFQDLGHTAVVIVGDWTAQLGDPSGKEGARTPLTAEEVKSNAQSYLDQFFTVVDKSKTEVRWQSEWFNQFTLADVFRLGYQKTVAQMLKRDHFEKRFQSGNEIYISEFLYPLLQGYDSIAVEADVELGGTDQTYNLLVGRELQERRGLPAQQIVTCKLIVGLDGKEKMSKSLNNYIMLTADPADMYGKIMSLPDYAMDAYYEGLTYIPEDEWAAMKKDMATGSLNPRNVKMVLAHAIVEQFHTTQAAQAAQEAFVKQFQNREWPEDMPLVYVRRATPIVQFMVDTKMAASKSMARQLIAQGGVTIRKDGAVEKVTDPFLELPAQNGIEVRVGKLKYARILIDTQEVAEQ